LCHNFKAFALTGRWFVYHENPGRCPGLGASALSGRAAQKLASALYLSLWPVTVGSGRVGLLSIPQSYGFIFKPARDFGEKLQKKLGVTISR